MRVGEGEVRLRGRVALSFQRYPRPSGPVELPVRSWGALPVARILSCRGTVAIPLADAEACWLGVSAIPGAASAPAVTSLEVWAMRQDGLFVSATGGAVVRGGGVRDLPRRAGLDVARTSSVDGLHADDRVWPFCRSLGPVQIERPDGAGWPGVVAIRLRLRIGTAVAEAVTVCLLTPADFTRQTGHLAGPPLDRDAVYGGWRLP